MTDCQCQVEYYDGWVCFFRSTVPANRMTWHLCKNKQWVTETFTWRHSFWFMITAVQTDTQQSSYQWIQTVLPQIIIVVFFWKKDKLRSHFYTSELQLQHDGKWKTTPSQLNLKKASAATKDPVFFQHRESKQPLLTALQKVILYSQL